jgi:hypothetical protein
MASTVPLERRALPARRETRGTPVALGTKVRPEIRAQPETAGRKDFPESGESKDLPAILESQEPLERPATKVPPAIRDYKATEAYRD